MRCSPSIYQVSMLPDNRHRQRCRDAVKVPCLCHTRLWRLMYSWCVSTASLHTAITYRPAAAESLTRFANSHALTSLWARRCSGPTSPPFAKSYIRYIQMYSIRTKRCILTWVLKNSTSPRIGCMMTMLAAALPTIQSPPATSTGCPLSEYGWMEAEMIGNLENMASPAPSAPLVYQLS